jgi:hypothetical protein
VASIGVSAVGVASIGVSAAGVASVGFSAAAVARTGVELTGEGWVGGVPAGRVAFAGFASVGPVPVVAGGVVLRGVRFVAAIFLAGAFLAPWAGT